MALNVALDVSAEAPWNGRSTPTISVLPALPPPPPPPDLLHAAVPATRVTAATASAVMRLVMLVLSVIDGVPGRAGPLPASRLARRRTVSGLAPSPTSLPEAPTHGGGQPPSMASA